MKENSSEPMNDDGRTAHRKTIRVQDRTGTTVPRTIAECRTSRHPRRPVGRLAA
jgi:hypothetical protein